MTDSGSPPPATPPAGSSSAGSPSAGSHSAGEWLSRLASRFGTEAPTADEVDAILGIAGIAAHSSERTAAPVTAWMIAKAGVSLADALAAVKEVAAELEARP